MCDIDELPGWQIRLNCLLSLNWFVLFVESNSRQSSFMPSLHRCILLLTLTCLALQLGCVNPSPKVAHGQSGQGKPLFDGRTLTGWKITDFAGHGEVRVDKGQLILEQGTMTGVTWTNDLPRLNYEISLEAMRVKGSDFFCALTFPVGKDPCSFIVGGWGGGVVGLSSIDGEDAANNETTKFMKFDTGRWYRIRVRVTGAEIQAWIDNEQVVNLVTADRGISIRVEVEPSTPLGIATFATTGAIRNVQLKSVPAVK